MCKTYHVIFNYLLIWLWCVVHIQIYCYYLKGLSHLKLSHHMGAYHWLSLAISVYPELSFAVSWCPWLSLFILPVGRGEWGWGPNKVRTYSKTYLILTFCIYLHKSTHTGPLMGYLESEEKMKNGFKNPVSMLFQSPPFFSWFFIIAPQNVFLSWKKLKTLTLDTVIKLNSESNVLRILKN